jgi:protein-S-isoprenylcysteine O-methyltransferase Ste14
MMAWLALALYVIWLLLGFAMRAAVQRRSTGDTGVRGFGGAPGTAAWWASLLLAVSHVGGILGPIAALLGLRPVPWLDRPWIQLTGLVVAVIGIGLSVVAQLAMGASWRIGVRGDERTTLVTEGPFGLVRNPIFSAVGLTGMGFALLVPNVVAWLLLAGLVVALELQVRLIEEPYLSRAHGVEYRAYASTVGRFVPLVGRLRS